MTSVGSEIVMNVKINDKQADRTTEDKTSDQRLTKYIPEELPDGRFWRNFSLTKFFLLYSTMGIWLSR